MNMASSNYDYDLIVIGSGAGGSIAAQHVAKAGKKVAIVEMGAFGGSEASTGRVPLSTLLHAASIYESLRGGSKFGIRGTTVGYNYPSLRAWKDHVVKRTGVHKGEEAFTEMGINVIRGRAYFIDDHTITIGNTRFSAREFLIATGSEAVLSQVPGLANSGFLTPREALNLTRPPKKLAIIGGGQTACELAQLFAIFGTKIYMFDSKPRLVSHEEPEASALLAATLTDLYSVDVVCGSSIEKVEAMRAGKKLTVRRNNKNSVVIVDEVLVATEKKAATDIGLENAGVHYQDGAIFTSNTMVTSAPHIYAAGSCAGPYNSTHAAAYQSQIVAHNILHKRKPLTINPLAIPRSIFTTPEVAAVGPTEEMLKTKDIDYKSVVVPLSVVTKANITDYSNGFVKVLADRKADILLGATIVSPNASDMIHELTLAVQNYMTAGSVARTVHVFPTWSEAVRVACSKLTKL